MSVYARDVGEGRPLVLIPGFGLNHEVWEGQVRALVEEHRVVCIDLRGTGRSDKPTGGYGIDRLADDVLEVLESLDLQEVTLVGWSFGGQVAFRLAARSPERLRQLVLIASNGVRASRSEEFPFGPDADALETALVRAEDEARTSSRRRAIRSGFHEEPEPELLDWLLRCHLQMPSRAAVPCYRTYLHSDLTADLPAVTLPVLQVIGAEDPVTSPEGAAWLRARLTDARLVEIAGCGHYPMFEAAERLDEELAAFAAAA